MNASDLQCILESAELDVTIDNTCDNPVPVTFCDNPFWLEVGLAPLGCAKDADGNVTGKVFLCKIVEEPSGATEWKQVLVQTDWTVVEWYTGSRDDCEDGCLRKVVSVLPKYDYVEATGECTEIELIEYQDECSEELTWDYYILSTTTNADWYKVKEIYTPVWEVIDFCPICDPETITYRLDDPKPIPFTNYTVMNSTCCDVIVTTSIGENIIPAWLWYTSPDFDCVVEKIEIKIDNPDGKECEESDVLITLNRTK